MSDVYVCATVPFYMLSVSEMPLISFQNSIGSMDVCPSLYDCGITASEPGASALYTKQEQNQQLSRQLASDKNQ